MRGYGVGRVFSDAGMAWLCAHQYNVHIITQLHTHYTHYAVAKPLHPHPSTTTQHNTTQKNRFIVYGKEKTAELEGESSALGDLLFTDDQLPVDKYLVRKTYFLFKYALEHYDVRFVLKTGDDSFVNVPLLVEELKTQCRHASCVRERLYFGKEMRNSEVC